MVTKEKAKIILEDGGTEKYTDEEVKKITDYLNKMAEIVYNSYQEKGNGKSKKNI